MSVPCLCCGYFTILERYDFEICPVCGWEDDNVQGDDPEYEGGANKVSLKEARSNFSTFGASSFDRLPRVRAPQDDEISNDV